VTRDFAIIHHPSAAPENPHLISWVSVSFLFPRCGLKVGRTCTFGCRDIPNGRIIILVSTAAMGWGRTVWIGHSSRIPLLVCRNCLKTFQLHMESFIAFGLKTSRSRML
jgi:hypothetical protein